MSQSSEAFPSDNYDAFANVLHDVQETLHDKSIDFRIIGSLAASAYIDGPEANSLDFNRVAASPAERVPDIDLIVPKGDLPELRQYRSELLAGAFPVKLGIAVPATTIDFRPSETVSYLRDGKLEVPFYTSVLDPVTVPFMGDTMQTISAKSLLHTYVTVGGKLRPVDMPRVRALSHIAQTDETNHESDYANFHEYIRARQAHPSISHRARGAVEASLQHLPLPDSVQHMVRRMGLQVATHLGWR